MKKKQKGFTLVELLVVIAILAILATISVVGYLSFTNKAKESNDKGIITQANNVLLSNEALGNKPNTMFDVIEQINNEGLNLEKLSPNSDGSHFVWDEEANRIYILKNDQIVFPENVSQPNKLLLWKIVDTYNEQEQYSQYIKKTNNTIVINNLDTGLDLGLNDGISEITYNRNEQSSKQKVKIRTNSTNAKVNINTANDSVEHYGLAGVINIEEVAEKSYHEFGQTAFMDVKKGRVVLEKESNIHQLNITKNQAGNGYDKVILANNGANNLPDKITRDDVVITDANGQTVVSIVDIKTNVEEIVKAYPTSNNSNSTLKNDIQNSNVVSPLGNLVLDKTDCENSITTETKTQEVETAIDKVLNDKFLTETNFVVRMGTKGFSTFDALVEEISNVDGKIVLLKDISFDSIKGIYDNVITINKNITIDLNGHNFVYSPVSDGSYWGPTRTLFFVNRTGTLKIIDSQKVKGTFRIEPTLKCNITFAENYGSMTLDGVNLDLVSNDTKGYYVKGVENKDGQTLSVLNSKLISKNLNGSLIKSYGNLIISNSELKISGRNDAVNIQNPGTATILQSTINIIDGVSATSGVNTYGNDVTIKDTTFNLDGAGYCVNASNGNVMLENITINMISDKLKASEAYGINLLKDVKVTVLGNSSITIQYPNFGATGINVLGGNMLLKDNLVVTDKNNNAYGLRVLSMALADFKNKPTVQIDSGIFNSDVNIQSEARVVINGGTFNGAFDTFKPTISIYNGTFKVDPNNSIAKVSDLTQKDGLFVVTLNLNKVVAYIDNVPYESLGSAINAVSNGQTIRLVKESTEQITISKNLDFYLDLNNNQFTGKINVPTDYNLQLDGNHYIIKAPAEAIVNGVEYQTVGDAIKAIESNKIAQGSIIELKRDTDTYSITINNSVKFKIDNKSFKINISITNGDTWSKSVYIDSTYNTTIWNGNSYSLNNCGGKIIEIK